MRGHRSRPSREEAAPIVAEAEESLAFTPFPAHCRSLPSNTRRSGPTARCAGASTSPASSRPAPRRSSASFVPCSARPTTTGRRASPDDRRATRGGAAGTTRARAKEECEARARWDHDDQRRDAVAPCSAMRCSPRRSSTAAPAPRHADHSEREPRAPAALFAVMAIADRSERDARGRGAGAWSRGRHSSPSASSARALCVDVALFPELRRTPAKELDSGGAEG